MSLDMFLDIEGEIEGESQDASHENEIDVLAWAWGLSQAGTFHHGGGGGAGKANFQDINITKWIDNSTPILQLYCANGDHFPSAKLTVRKAGADPLEYLIITMTNVLVTSVQSGGSGGEDKLTENVSLNFAEVEVQYTKQLEGGGGDTPKLFGWDIASNIQTA